MSLKHLLMPYLSAKFLSRERLLKQRAKAERARVRAGRGHELHYFHQVDDPYSALMAQVLPKLLSRYQVKVIPHVVGPPSDAAAPDRARLAAYSRDDAHRLAQHHGLMFPPDCGPVNPEDLELATRLLVASVENGSFTETVVPLTSALWHKQDGAQAHLPANAAQANDEQVRRHLKASNDLRERLGHYLGATLFYEGEWYWGLDRLYHLEQRLQDLHLQTGVFNGPLFAPDRGQTVGAIKPLQAVPDIDFYFSFRSPYSAIVAKRVFELAHETGAHVNLRYLLPMVMRGLPVPANKRRYIAQDAAREATVRQIPFGRINDPLGRPVERGLALMPLAERQGKGQAYVLSFMQGVWAEGLHAGSDKGLRTMAERAGLNWAEAQVALADDRWRTIAESNRQELLGLGLWGVPSFRVGNTAVWGQDRLWAVQQALVHPPSSLQDTAFL